MAASTKRILHVEDDPSTQDYIRSLLGPEGELTQTDSIREARRLLQESRFDLLLLDLLLPDGSGLDLLHDAQLTLPPVIVFSAHEVTDSLPTVEHILVKGRFAEQDLIASARALLAG